MSAIETRAPFGTALFRRSFRDPPAIERLGEIGPFGGHFPQDDAGFPTGHGPGDGQTVFRIADVFVPIRHDHSSEC